MKTPIFRIFQLALDVAREEEYTVAGKHNLLTSIDTEAGTKAMFVNHVQGDKSQQIVVEVYADEEAYEIHHASEHFQAFAKTASQVILDRKVIELDSQILLQKPAALKVTAENELCIRLVPVRVSDSDIFREIVFPEMKQSMAEEEGVLLMFAGTDKKHSDSWYFYEIYQNQDAYHNHCQKAYFQTYLAKTKNIVLEKDFFDLVGDILVTKGESEK